MIYYCGMQEVPCNLSDCFLCSFCIPEWKEAIAVKKTSLLIKKGKQVFNEREKVIGIYFIYSGAVKVHQKWLDQKELIIRFSKKGDILGHRGLGNSDLYPVSATALQDTVVCFISSDFLEATLKSNHALTYKLMHLYADELQKVERRMRNLVHMEVKGRIADALLEIHNFFGTDKEKYFNTTINRSDIASYAGTTYETVFKFFTELVNNKIITTSGKNIRINELEKLRNYVGKNG
ncbi:MAG: Crp/Fnr family transcriptional regulator [Chitinophagaceae bacterium]